MASISDEPSSSSPKRIKLDDIEDHTKSVTDNCFSKLGHSFEVINRSSEDFRGKTVVPMDQELATNQEIEKEDKDNPPEESSDLDAVDNEEEDPDDDDDDDDVSSTVSNVSNLSGLSEMSGQHWKPIANVIGSVSWLEKQMIKGVSPRVVFSQITGETIPLPETISDIALWKVIFTYLTEPPKRSKLPNVNSLDDVVNLLRTCTKILVLTGAGVSVSCGIPDFRSRDGVYARLAVDFPDLPDPQAMFDINYFRQDPRPFFKFAREIYPGQFKPSPCHRFIKMLERQKKLLRNYTQNIDTLEKVAGIENVVECHGSFATATCTRCGHKASADDIRDDVFKQQIPFCPICLPGATSEAEKGVMKPDIVFFGEGLPESFHDAMAKDKDECDLLIVIGSSLKVRPVALIPSSLPGHVPQILINRERLPHLNFDVELLGDSDIIIDQLCYMLGEEWGKIRWREAPLTELPNNSQSLECRSDYSSSDESETERTSGIKCQRIGRRVAEGDENSRHISMDSSLSRDSGIGDSSNSSNERSPSPAACSVDISDTKNNFFPLKKRRYIFPGAEGIEQHLLEVNTD